MIPTEDSGSPNREAFIPFCLDDLIATCLDDGVLDPEERGSFGELCRILTARLHFEFHADSESIKRSYDPFDPDRDTFLLEKEIDLEEREESLIEGFHSIARRANYFEISREEIEKCFDAVTLIDLKTSVDLNDFDRVVCYARGDIEKEMTVKGWFRSRKISVDILQRVLLLFKFKGEDYFQSSKKKQKENERSLFEPGMIYTYFYKDVPKYDLELLFPNVRVGMNLKQKLLFAVPAIGGSIGVFIKVIPQLLILVGVVMFLIGGRAWLEVLGLREESVSKFMPVMVALMGVVMALGGLAIKQWGGYRRKRFQLLKDVTEQLFFRNLATNRSVFNRVIDSAEEEESKEMVLVFYHLVSSPDEELPPEALDAKIEHWMAERLGSAIDFDIDGSLAYLSKVRGPGCDGREMALVEIDDRGIIRAASIEDSKHILDHLWDDAFGYANRG